MHKLINDLTWHGKLRSYSHRFKIIEDPTCILQMWQTNTQFIQISKTNMGSQPLSAADYIKRGDTTSHTLQCPGMGRRRFGYNRLKYIRVQRLMNIKIAKAFRTTSSEALCILVGTTLSLLELKRRLSSILLERG